MSKKQEQMRNIAKMLNSENIRWCVGGSMLLLHLGLCDEPNDLDIIVHKDDAQKAIDILRGIWEEKDVPKSDIFVSDIYKKFIADGIEVDLIAGFKIKHKSGVYEYKPDFAMPESIDKVMYANPEDWAKLYGLMPEKKKKAEILVEWLQRMAGNN